eukprot:9885136-Alexandrium_andersonii.AAC.1
MTLAAPKYLKVGSTCSGAGTMEFALEALGQQFRSQFACDCNNAAMKFYTAHHNSKFFLADAMDETHTHAPYVDLYSAGWPCQPFSSQGNLRGMGDVRSQPIHPILNFIRTKKPRAIFLENVPNIVTKFRDTFDWVVNELKGMVGDGGDALYHIRWKVLRTDWYGIPQTRARLYIIGIRSDSLRKSFQWPEPFDCEPLEAFLDMDDCVAGKTRYPPTKQTHANKNLRTVLKQLAADGIEARNHPVIVNTVSVNAHYTINKIGTITATLGSNLGFWIPMLNRQIKIEEIMKLQGFDPERIDKDAVSQRQLGRILGNAFSQNVVASVLKVLVPAAGLWQKPAA